MTNKRVLENKFKQDLRKKILNKYPGSVILNNDPNQVQGVSDILVLYGATWAMLEGKRSRKAPYRPNQPYYIDLFNNMSFGARIYPENEKIILSKLDAWFTFVSQFNLKKNFTKRGGLYVVE